MQKIILILMIVTSAQGQKCHEHKNHPLAKTIVENTLNTLSSELQNKINNLSADVEIERYKTHEWLLEKSNVLDYLSNQVFNQTGNADCNNTLKKRIMLYCKRLSRLYNGKPRPLDYFYDSIYRTQVWFDEKFCDMRKIYISETETYGLDEIKTKTMQIRKSFVDSIGHLDTYIDNLKLVFGYYKMNAKFPSSEDQDFLDELNREILSTPFENCERDELYSSC